MASQASSRQSFINRSISVARSYNFYGLDIDWEYPSMPTEMKKLGSLLNEWRTSLNKKSTITGNTRLLLLAAFFHNSNYFTILYPIQDIRNSLDWINVMA
ncbi:hypothetical protein V6N13_130572 [Hibiscus sabdariffa]|uniref:Uncharacterized protein n=2 Tax=Hibiscus sabdariffa TaxID=183260 RepID=A0ABR2AKD0_9ROSI